MSPAGIISICAEHGTFPSLAKVKVCHGRKACYVLKFGNIHSACCFVKEKPSNSFKGESFEHAENQWILIPNGWKVAVLVEGKIWIGETWYGERNESPLFAFSKWYENGNTEATKIWKPNPSAAFRAALEFHGEVEDTKITRHNGKLLMGVHYGFPQDKLKSYFSNPANRNGMPQEAEEKLILWLNQPASFPTVSTTTSLSTANDIYANLPENKRMRMVTASSLSGIPTLSGTPSPTLVASISQEKKPLLLKDTEMLDHLKLISPTLELNHVKRIYEVCNKQILSVDEFLEFLRKSEKVVENLQQFQDQQRFHEITKEEPPVLAYVLKKMMENSPLQQMQINSITRLPSAQQLSFLTQSFPATYMQVQAQTMPQQQLQTGSNMEKLIQACFLGTK